MVQINLFKKKLYQKTKSVCGKMKPKTSCCKKTIDQKIDYKKIVKPQFKNFYKLIEKTRQFARDKNITSNNLEGVIKQARK